MRYIAEIRIFLVTVRRSNRNMVFASLLLTAPMLNLLIGCSSLDEDNIQEEKAVDRIPDADWARFTYLRTDMALDGGSIYQSYRTVDGSIYKLWIPPARNEGKGRRIYWLLPSGQKYLVAGSENVHLISDFLTRMRVKNMNDSLVREDIGHALLLVAGLQPVMLWNFGSQRDFIEQK